MTLSLRQRRRVWTPVGAWAVLVVFALTRTGRELAPLRPLAGLATAAVAHLALFGVLGYLVARALRLEGRLERSTLLAAFGGCVGFALLTEALQAIVPGRSPMGVDVVLDVAGAGAGLWLGRLSRRPS